MSKAAKSGAAMDGPGSEIGAIGLNELASLLPWFGEKDEITIRVRVDTLRQALTMALGGPEVMSTAQAAEIIGWSAKRWRGWAEQGRVEGAKQEENGDWRLPREGCLKRKEEELAAGRRPARKVGIEASAILPRAMSPRSTRTPGAPSIRRGPRKAA